MHRLFRRLSIAASALLGMFLTLYVPARAQTATVSGSTVYQVISGWGASTGYNERNNNLTSAQADCFFSTSNASCAAGNSIGLSVIRIQDNQTAGSAPDLPTLLLAQARGAQIELGFNPAALNIGSYASTASYDVAKIQYLQSHGLTVSAISPINEPLNTGTTGAEIDTFVASYLYPALVTAGLNTIPITLPEGSYWFPANASTQDFTSACMNDSNCGPHIAAVSGHGYFGYGSQAGSQTVDGFPTLGVWAECCVQYSANPPPSVAAGKPVWQTEINGGFTGPCVVDKGLANYDSSQADALVWAHNIHDFLTVAGGTQWLFWNLASETANGATSCNDGLTDQSFNPAKRFYAIGNWSRFVRPGWVRVAATASPQANVYVTAFTDTSTGAFVIVVINDQGRQVSQPFSLRGLSASSVTPWITDASNNLASRPPVQISGSAFTAKLTANSVTTYVSNSSNGRKSGTGNHAPQVWWSGLIKRRE